MTAVVPARSGSDKKSDAIATTPQRHRRGRSQPSQLQRPADRKRPITSLRRAMIMRAPSRDGEHAVDAALQNSAEIG